MFRDAVPHPHNHPRDQPQHQPGAGAGASAGGCTSHPGEGAEPGASFTRGPGRVGGRGGDHLRPDPVPEDGHGPPARHSQRHQQAVQADGRHAQVHGALHKVTHDPAVILSYYDYIIVAGRSSTST